MLIIRFQRVGKKNEPHFRLVLTEKTNPPRGKFHEVLGWYNPKNKKYGLKEDRIKHWLAKGVKVSATCHNLLVKAGISKGPKIKVHSVKKTAGEKPEISAAPELPKEDSAKTEEK